MANQPDVVNEVVQIQQAVETDNPEFANPILTSPSNSNNDNLSGNTSDVCRDFLRNCCRRGPSCRFSHPDLSETKKCEIPLLTFCHDFQNRECRRPNCKFVHCSKQDEELFKQTGKVPETVNYGFGAGSQSANGPSGNQTNPNNNKFNGPKKFNNNNAVANGSNGNFVQQNAGNFKEQEAPICKDFAKGDCFRGVKCKFKHVAQPDRNFNSNGNKTTFDGSFECVGKSFGGPTNASAPNDARFTNSNPLMQPAQRFDQMNQMKANSPMNHPVNRESSSFQIPVDRRNNLRGTPMFEPEAKRRAFDSGYNTPTTFTFANNNANSQLLVTTALNQIHNNATHPNNTNTANPETSSAQSAQTAVLAAAVNAINELNGSNVTTSSSANTITRSMYNNLNESRFLLEENNNLRREIDKLKQQVVDLMNANEFLLEQNAQLRNSIMPPTSVNQNLAVSTTLHNPVTALHSNTVVQKAPSSNPVVPTSSQPTSLQATLPPHINPSTISSTELLVANHLHRQSQQINQQRAAAAVAAVASATSSALSSMSSNPLTSNPLSSNPLSAASSISSLTVTSTSAPLVSYPIIQSNNPIMSASIPHSLGHLTH